MKNAGLTTLNFCQALFDFVPQKQLIHNLVKRSRLGHLLDGIKNQFAVAHVFKTMRRNDCERKLNFVMSSLLFNFMLHLRVSMVDIPNLFAQTRTSVSHLRRETVAPPNSLAIHRVQAPP
jgi:hypothetical protein